MSNAKAEPRRKPRSRATLFRTLAVIYAELAETEATSAPEDDRRSSRDRLPEDVRHLKNGSRVVREACSRGEIEGAVQMRDGSWHFSDDAWRRARTRKVTPARLTLVEPVEQDDDAVAEAALQSAGLRGTVPRRG